MIQLFWIKRRSKISLVRLVSMNTSALSLSSSSFPHVSDVCVFGSESGLGFSHALLSINRIWCSESTSLSSPHHLLLYHFFADHLFLPPPIAPVTFCLPVHLLQSVFSEAFEPFVRLVEKDSFCLFCPPLCSLIPPSALRARWKGGVSARELRWLEWKGWKSSRDKRHFYYCQWEKNRKCREFCL